MVLDELPTLDIRVSRGPDGGHVVALQIGEREFPVGPLGRDGLSTETGDAEAGARLFAALIEDPRVRSAWDVAAGLHPRRRVRLRLDEAAPELHTLPWEALRDDSPMATTRALAADRDTPFSRHVACAWEPLGATDERPLRVLTAVAAPRGLEAYDMPAIDRAAEERSLAEAMRAAPAGLVEHTALQGPCTLAALEAALEGGYHVLHIVAHGVVRRGGNPGVAMFLEQDGGEIDRVEAPRFAAMIERLRASLRLVVLMSCNTAARSSTDARFGYAPALLAAGVPAVVAMQDRMPMTTGAAFTRAFYSELWASGEIDRAANRARAVVLTERLPGSAIPVLYAARASLRLWSPSASPPAPQQVVQSQQQQQQAAAPRIVAPSDAAAAGDSPDEEVVAPQAAAVARDMSDEEAGEPVWEAFGGSCRELKIARESGGNLIVFGLHADRTVWQRSQSPKGEWGEWTLVGDDVEQFDVVMDRRGRLWVFGVDRRGACWMVAQSAPYGNWGRPRRLGMGASQMKALCKTDGRIVVFALDGDSIHINEQVEPGGSFGEWYEVDGGYTKIVVARNGFGHLVLFGITDDPAIYASVQRAPGGAWSDWEEVAEETADLAVETGPDGRLHLACVDSEQGLWYVKEKRPGQELGDWEDLKATGKQAVGFFRSDAQYELYALDAKGAVWRTRRAKGGWEAWMCLGGIGYAQLDVFEDEKGELLVLAVAESGRIYRLARAPEGSRPNARV